MIRNLGLPGAAALLALGLTLSALLPACNSPQYATTYTYLPTPTPLCTTPSQLGYSAAGAVTALASGTLLANPVAVASGPVTALDFQVYTGDRGRYKAALYTDNAGAPATLVAQTDVMDSAGPGWIRIPIRPTALASGNYWLALVQDQGDDLIRDDSSAVPLFSSPVTSWTLPANPVGTLASGSLSVYAETCP